MTDTSKGTARLRQGPDLLTESNRRVVSPTSAHTAVWVALAPLLAGRPVIRQSHNGGRTYPHRWQRAIEEYSDRFPTAVPVYSSAGDTRVLVVDLDSSRHGHGQVLHDADAIRALIARSGGRLISDESPNGGVHLYLPLIEPVDFHTARDVAEALALRSPSMDTTPNQNLKAGLIRTPGARHSTGGFQTLHGPLAEAIDTARLRNPSTVWTQLTRELAVELAIVTAERARVAVGTTTATADPDPSTITAFVRRGGPREIAGDYLRIAATGDYDTARYRSPSQARQAVLTAAAWAGLSLVDVLTRLRDGRWAGLNSFYARYKNPTARREALTKFDWPHAMAAVAAERAKNPTPRTVRVSPTSELATHRPPSGGREANRNTQAEFQFLRSWHSAMAYAEQADQQITGWITRRMVLRAIGAAAKMTGSRYVHFGTRSLSIGAGVDHTTVAAHLRVLRSGPDALISLIEDNRGIDGDLYELVIPDRYAGRAERRGWRGGKLHALRPAFLELGAPAALVYEALEHTTDPLRGIDLIGATGLARDTVYKALHTLAAYNLARQDAGRWRIVTTTSLSALAEEFGVLDAIKSRVLRHRNERAAYRLLLLNGKQNVPANPRGADWYVWPGEPPPDDSGMSALELLQQMLGATLVPM